MYNSIAFQFVNSRSEKFARREDGSLTIFSMFLFILLLMICGMAVDMAVHERQRVRVQNTIDTAVLATGSLTSTAATNAEVTAVVRDYVAKAGIDPNLVTVTPNVDERQRDVIATANFEINTIFMGLLGIDELQGGATGQAFESEEDVEIVLVLDLSGSMGNGGKIEALRPAARGFVTEMINKVGADRLSISIVPYAGQVRIDDDLAARLDWQDDTIAVNLPAGSHPGAIANYQTRNPTSRCARFRTDDFQTTSLTATAQVEALATFRRASGNNNAQVGQYSGRDRWCSDDFSPILLYQNNETALHTYINNLEPYGWTQGGIGMNWGAGILHPDFRPTLTSLINDNVLTDVNVGHPFDINEPNTKKVIVLMTDGRNNEHIDLQDNFKSGPSPVWYSETQANGEELNGFLVENPDSSPEQRWFVPNQPNNDGDNEFVAEGALPADAVQWDYHQVFGRFRSESVSKYLFDNDPALEALHAAPIADGGSDGVSDDQLVDICGEALEDNISVYTIAFQAGDNAEQVMRDCVGPDHPGRYFDVDGLDIATAFEAIVIELTSLRLTQ